MDGKTRALRQIEEEGRHIGETAKGPSMQITCGNTGRNRTMGLSYRRLNRSYTKEKTTKWTKQMNKELYRMYFQSEPERKGYIKRLEEIWNSNNNKSPKEMTREHPAEQVRNLKKKKLLNDEEIKLIELEMITPICIQLNSTEDISSQEQQPVASLLESSDDVHLGQQDEHHRTENNTQKNIVNDQDIRLKEEIKTIWIRNYKKYTEIDITKREFMTKAKPLPQKHFQFMDEI